MIHNINVVFDRNTFADYFVDQYKEGILYCKIFTKISKIIIIILFTILFAFLMAVCTSDMRGSFGATMGIVVVLTGWICGVSAVIFVLAEKKKFYGDMIEIAKLKRTAKSMITILMKNLPAFSSSEMVINILLTSTYVRVTCDDNGLLFEYRVEGSSKKKSYRVTRVNAHDIGDKHTLIVYPNAFELSTEFICERTYLRYAYTIDRNGVVKPCNMFYDLAKRG